MIRIVYNIFKINKCIIFGDELNINGNELGCSYNTESVIDKSINNRNLQIQLNGGKEADM